MSRVRVLFDPSHSASCGGVVEARDDAARDRLAWDVYLLRCTRVDKGQSLVVGLRERMDAVARGIHSAVIREASALEFKPFAHPAR